MKRLFSAACISLTVAAFGCSREVPADAGKRVGSAETSSWKLADGSMLTVHVRPWPPAQWQRMEIRAEVHKGTWNKESVVSETVKMGISNGDGTVPKWTEMVKGEPTPEFVPFFSMTSLAKGKYAFVFKPEGAEFTKAESEDPKFKIDLEPWEFEVK